ncbi:MAG: hypothetical protein PWR10_37 [Halanaerobiales bacterium]|nr:hypothetical protein [Halanaerobiales bacterium]
MKRNHYYLGQKNYKRRTKGEKNLIYLLLFIFIIILLFSIGFFLLNRQHGSVVLARYGQIVDGFQTRGLLVREERVYYSPHSGKIILKQGEGDRVSYGQKVLQIGDLVLHNHQPGIISYATDGLEERLTPGILKKLSIRDFNHIKRDYRQLVNGDYLKEGQPAFRIINNNYLYIVIKTDASEVQRYRINEVVFLKPLKLNKGLIDGRIAYKVINGKEGLLIVKLNPFISEWLNQRWVEIIFIKNIYRGVVIPREAVFTKPEGEGVLLYNHDGSYVFQKVKVLEGNEDKVIVEGLEIGESLIENPAVVDFGRGV